MFLGGLNSACIKLVKCEKIQYFLEMCDHASDVFYTMKLFDNSEKIKQIDDIIYVYRRNKNSITLNGKYKSDTEKFYNAVDALSKTIKNTNVLNAILYRIKCYKTNKIDF
jgi:replication-associated recombination protein RarA